MPVWKNDMYKNYITTVETGPERGDTITATTTSTTTTSTKKSLPTTSPTGEIEVSSIFLQYHAYYLSPEICLYELATFY